MSLNGEMGPKEIAARLGGRSRRYVRATIALLTLSLGLAVCVISVAEHQGREVSRDFGDNARVHLIQVDAPAESSRSSGLRSSDAGTISAVIKQRAPGVRAHVFAVYRISGGLVTHENEALFLYSLGDAAAARELLDVTAFIPGIGYVAKGSATPAPIWAPVVEVSSRGFDSNKMVIAPLRLRATLQPQWTALLSGGLPQSVVLTSLPTFERVADEMFGGRESTQIFCIRARSGPACAPVDRGTPVAGLARSSRLTRLSLVVS